jgi:hypothetical protein
MNERIRELAEQAMIPFKDENLFECYHFSKEKFAELIVKECAELMPQDNLYNMVLKHFGVEE